LLLGVGPKSSSTKTKLSEHETNRGEAEKSERVSGEIFEILGQPAAAIKPSESAFDILVIRTGPARTAPLGSSFQLSGKNSPATLSLPTDLAPKAYASQP
jgi:hypothetical protein